MSLVFFCTLTLLFFHIGLSVLQLLSLYKYHLALSCSVLFSHHCNIFSFSMTVFFPLNFSFFELSSIFRVQHYLALDLLSETQLAVTLLFQISETIFSNSIAQYFLYNHTRHHFSTFNTCKIFYKPTVIAIFAWVGRGIKLRRSITVLV